MDHKNSHPLVSVIVPVYNVEQYLEQCVNSICDQTIKEIEIILVDDGSSDNCPRICDQFSSKDDRIRVIHQENQGVSIARNRGMEIALGEWVMFVDSDDWIDENTIEMLYSQAVASDCDIICGLFYDNYIKEQNGNKLEKGEAEEYLLPQELPLLIGYVVHAQSSNINMSSPWCKLYRHRILKDNGCIFPEKMNRPEDLIFNLYAIQAAAKICFFNIPLYHYRIWPHSNSGLSFAAQAEILQRYWSELNNFMQKCELREAFEPFQNFAILTFLFEEIQIYGSICNGLNDVLNNAIILKGLCELPACTDIVNKAVGASMISRNRRFALWLLKLRMYKLLLLISWVRGKIIKRR